MVRTISLLMLGLTFLVSGQDTGSLLIIGPEGYRVYLGDQFMGFTSTEQDGIFLESVEQGVYVLSIKKQDRVVVSQEIEIVSSETKEFSFKEEDEENKIIRLRTNGIYKGNSESVQQGLFSTRRYPTNNFYIFEGELSKDQGTGRIVIDQKSNLKSNKRIDLLRTKHNPDRNIYVIEIRYYYEENNRIRIKGEYDSDMITLIDEETFIQGDVTYRWMPGN